MTNAIRSLTRLLVITSACIVTIWIFTTVAFAQISTTSASLTLTATPAENGATLTWTTSNTVSCIASQGNPGWPGVKVATGGSQTVTPTVTTAFSMECWSTNGFTSGLKTLYISPNGVVGPATTNTDNTAILALINQLMAQIASLQAQLLALQQGTTPTTPPTGLLTQNLSLGSTGAQVTLLQTKLATLGYLDDENISGYFGPITEAAVKKYQCDKGIVCTGTLSTTGYGGVGPTTRAALNGTTTGGTTPTTPTTPTAPTTPTCLSGTIWNGSTCVEGTVSTAPAPTARLTFTRDDGVKSNTTSKTISEKCYIQPGKSNCSITISWTTQNAIDAVLNFAQLADPNLYNDPRFSTRGTTGSRTVRLDPQLATPHPGYNIGSQLMSFSVQGEGDQSTHYSITLNALCAKGEWDKVNGMCPPETTTTPTPVEPTPAPTTGPTANLTISPAGTVIYPTMVTYTLSSTGAQSCSIVDYMGTSYVSPTDNLTNMTITSITTPQTAVFSTKCWSGPNGTGAVSATKTTTLIVKCPTNTAWNGTVCK